MHFYTAVTHPEMEVITCFSRHFHVFLKAWVTFRQISSDTLGMCICFIIRAIDNLHSMSHCLCSSAIWQQHKCSHYLITCPVLVEMCSNRSKSWHLNTYSYPALHNLSWHKYSKSHANWQFIIYDAKMLVTSTKKMIVC